MNKYIAAYVHARDARWRAKRDEIAALSLACVKARTPPRHRRKAVRADVVPGAVIWQHGAEDWGERRWDWTVVDASGSSNDGYTSYVDHEGRTCTLENAWVEESKVK